MKTRITSLFAGFFLLANAAMAQPSLSGSVLGGSGYSGVVQTLYAGFGDSDGYWDISDAEVLINGGCAGIGCGSVSTANACYVMISSGYLYLANDAGAGWMGPVTPGSGDSAQNSRCKLYGAGSSVSGSGTALYVNVSVSFTSAMLGYHGVYTSVSSYQGYTAPLQWSETINLGLGVPDLTIAKTHAGNFTQGQTGAQYTITVSNSGGAPSGGATVTDTLPTGLTATAISGTGWTCTQPGGPCSSSDTVTDLGSYPPLTLTVNVALGTPASITNRADVSGGGESNTTNNTAYDQTTVNIGGGTPNLTITNTHAGDFRLGERGVTYALVVGNNGTATTNATVTVTDTLPTGLTASGIVGTGWTCSQPGGPCTRTDGLVVGTMYPPIIVTVDVAGNAPVRVTNTATASGGGDPTPASGRRTR